MSIWKNGKLVAGGSQALPLLTFMWADHILDDISWLRANTFSWQSGSVYQAVYQHLANDIDGKSLQSETVDGTTIQFYLADDGHKICPASEESNVVAIYTATGVAWYYIIDTVNERFKLPRSKHNRYTETLGVVGNGKNTVYTNGTNDCVFNPYFGSSNNGIFVDRKAANINVAVGTAMGTATNITEHTAIGLNTDPAKTNVLTTPIPQDTDQYKYLYFYVGAFTQTALENTAGVVTEDFNELNAHKVIAFQAPTAENNYTWYRKYADGWVEQGGEWVHPSPGTAYNNVTITLPVVMSDSNYSVILSNTGTNGTAYTKTVNTRTTTDFICTGAGDVSKYNGFCWAVRGMAA